MGALLSFLAVATLAGCAIWGSVRLRRRAVASQPGVSEEDLCRLDQASRISSLAVAATLAALAVAGSVYVLVRLT